MRTGAISDCSIVRYQHCVTVGIKAISLFDSVVIGSEDVFEPCEGRYQCQQRGFGQMKVCYHCIGYLELIAGLYEQLRRAACPIRRKAP